MIAKQDKNHNSRKGNDGRSISVDWWRSQGRNLQYTLTQRKEMERQAQDLRLSEGLAELGILKSLEGKIIGYLKAEEEFSPELARYSSFRIDLDQAREVATTLTTIIQEKVRDYGRYVRRRIIAVVPKLQEEEQGAVGELAYFCQNYASLEQLDARVIPRTLLNPYLRDVGELAGLASREVQGIKERYLAASTVEEITALKTELEETVVGPFLRKRDQLQQKYSFQYTARIFPCWREYRALGMEMSKPWQELAGELEVVSRKPLEILSYRRELIKKTKELAQLQQELGPPELTSAYLQNLQQIKELMAKTPLPEASLQRTASCYLVKAQQQYKLVLGKMEKVKEEAKLFFTQQLKTVMTTGYSQAEEIEAALPKLYCLEEAFSILGNIEQQQRLQGWMKQLTKAHQGFSRFTSIAGIENYFSQLLHQPDGPFDQQQREVYALLAGLDPSGRFVGDSFWGRVGKLGAANMVEAMALAEEYAVPQALNPVIPPAGA